MSKKPLYFGTKLVSDETLPLCELPKVERIRLFIEYLNLIVSDSLETDSAWQCPITKPKLSPYIYPYKEDIFEKLLAVESELERMQIFLTLVYTQCRPFVDAALEHGFEVAMKDYMDGVYPANVTKLMQIYFYKGCVVREWVRDEVQQVLAPYHIAKCKSLASNKISIDDYFNSSYADYKYTLPIKQKRLKFSTHVLSQLLSFFYPESIDAESYMAPGPGSAIGLANLLNKQIKPSAMRDESIEFFSEVMSHKDYPIDKFHYSALEAHQCYFANYKVKLNGTFVGKFYAHKLNYGKTN